MNALVAGHQKESVDQSVEVITVVKKTPLHFIQQNMVAAGGTNHER